VIIETIRSYESTGGRMHPDFTPSYGIPYAVVDGSTPLVPVTFGNTSESDRGAPDGPTGLSHSCRRDHECAIHREFGWS
jgi:hypothetical protein